MGEREKEVYRNVKKERKVGRDGKRGVGSKVKWEKWRGEDKGEKGEEGKKKGRKM